MRAVLLTRSREHGVLRLRSCVLVLLVFLFFDCLANAQSAPSGTQGFEQKQTPSMGIAIAHGHPQVAPPKAAASSQNQKTAASSPAWSSLTQPQQAILKPLLTSWDTLTEGQKRKWLAVTKNYPSMNADEQAKLQSRMNEWANLTTQQRTQARLNYVQAKALTPSERQAKWRAYQELSEDEKRKLAAKATVSVKGAAPAVKPAASQHLTVVPTSQQSVKPGQKIAVGTHNVDQKTLLPKQTPSATLTTSVQAPDSAASTAPTPN